VGAPEPAWIRFSNRILRDSNGLRYTRPPRCIIQVSDIREALCGYPNGAIFLTKGLKPLLKSAGEHEKAVPEHWERMLACEIEMRWVCGRRPSLAQVARAALPYRISRDGVAKLRGDGERYSRLLHYRLGCLIAARMAEEEGEGFTLQTTQILCE
jgi:glutathione S-transferase